MAISLFGCAPATPIVLMVPTAAAINPTATPIVPPTHTPVPIPTQTPFVPKATIKIFVHTALTGSGARGGNDIARAAEQASLQLSGPLMELGYQLKLVPFDDQANAETSVANAKQIAADPEILCGVEHHETSLLLQTSEIYHLYGLSFITPSNSATSVTDRNYLEVNRIVGRDDGHGIVAAQFAQAQGFTRVYILHSSSNHSEKNADYFQREARTIGLPVAGVWDTDLKENFEWVLRRVLAANPDLVYFATKADQIGPFIREARAAGYTGAFMSSDQANRSTLSELAGSAIAEGGGTYFTDIVAPADFYVGATKFVSDFKNNYDSKPREFSAQAYDATGICIKAIEEAVKAKGGELPTRKDVANAIRSLVDYQGITGIYSFNKRGDLNPARFYVFKVASSDPANWDQNIVVATFDIEQPK